MIHMLRRPRYNDRAGCIKVIVFTTAFVLLSLSIGIVSATPQLYLDSYNASLKLNMHMNGTEGGTTFTDETGKSVSAVGGVQTSTSNPRFGNASALFNGAGYITVGSASDWKFLHDGSTNYTWSVWANTTNFTATQSLWGTSDTYSSNVGAYALITTDRRVQWVIDYGSSGNHILLLASDVGAYPNDGAWHHLVGAFDNNATGNAYLYLDGILIKTQAKTANVPSTSDPYMTLNIGRSDPTFLLSGQIDEIGIWSTFIPDSELDPQQQEIETTIPPVATFTATPTEGSTPLSVQFTETSTSSGTSWQWNATNVTGNNVPFTFNSTSGSPVYIFNSAGNYSISLKSTNGGGTNISTQVTFVNVSSYPTASFTQNKTFGVLPFAVSFTDTSLGSPNIWVWSVDGTEVQNSSTTQNFAHTFDVAGTHQVNLTVWNTTLTTTPSTASQDILVYPTTYSDFAISNDHPVIFQDTVTFTPIGPLVANRWLWNFGDGNIFLDTNGTAVTHMYETSASNTTLSVSLTAYLIENTNITNTTSHTIDPVLPTSYVEASFSGSPTSGSVGVNVMFTDTSKFGASNADSGRTYNWSFGDDGYSANPYSNVVGGVSHVYTNLGTYTVTLTVNNTYNSSSYSIVNFITVSNQQNYAVTYPPKDVRFHIQTLYGQAIPNTLVQANPRQTSTGSYAYTASLFGYQLGVVPLNNLTLSGYTDSKGDITLAMMADVQYELGFAATGYTFDNQTITPHDDNYIIMPRGTGGSPFVTNGSSPQTNVLFTATYTRYNETAALLHINYTDYSLLTTSGDILLYRPNTSLGYTYNNVSEQENFVSVHFTGSNTTQGYILIDGATPACPSSSSAIFTDTYTLVACTNQTLVNDKSYFAAATGMTPGGNVSVQAPVWFKNIHTPIAGLSAEFALFAALGIMMFTAMMATPTTAPAISIAFAFEGWIFYGMNMLQLIDSPTQSGASVVVEVLIVITGIAIVYNFVDFRRKGK